MLLLLTLSLRSLYKHTIDGETDRELSSEEAELLQLLQFHLLLQHLQSADLCHQHPTANTHTHTHTHTQRRKREDSRIKKEAISQYALPFPHALPCHCPKLEGIANYAACMENAFQEASQS